jgi:gas vesicle protein
MSDSDAEIGAFMAGFVIGGLVGAATALILAPQSGAETRAQIATKSDEMRQAGEQQFADYKRKAGEAVSETQSRVQTSSDEIQERARIVLDEGKQKDARSAQKNGPNAAQASSGQAAESEPGVDDLAGDAPA